MLYKTVAHIHAVCSLNLLLFPNQITIFNEGGGAYVNCFIYAAHVLLLNNNSISKNIKTKNLYIILF